MDTTIVILHKGQQLAYINAELKISSGVSYDKPEIFITFSRYARNNGKYITTGTSVLKINETRKVKNISFESGKIIVEIMAKKILWPKTATNKLLSEFEKTATLMQSIVDMANGQVNNGQ